MTDPISDMLTRIRNGLAARRATVSFPYSKIKEAIAKILKDNGFIEDFEVDGTAKFKAIVVTLGEPQSKTINNLTRISKPGRRIYAGASELPTVLSGRGLVIVSTSAGVMTGREAKKRGLGGELICKVW